MNVGSDLKHLRRSADKRLSRKASDRLAILACAVISVVGTLSFLIILADSL